MRVVLHEPTGSMFAAHQLTESADFREVEAHELRAGTQIATPSGQSTVLADMDWETYSEAGYWFEEGVGRSGLGKWQKVEGAPDGSGSSSPIAIAGAPAYSEHPSTEILMLWYNLKDGKGPRCWLPCMPPPQELFDFIAAGGLIEAHNSAFEWFIWQNVAHKRLGWPPLPFTQLRCSMAKCRAYSIPGGLEDAGAVLDIKNEKLAKEGKRLIDKFSGPRNPTKADLRRRIRPEEDPEDFANFCEYGAGDIVAESNVSACVPDLSQEEQQLWLLDQLINFTGCQIDLTSVESCRQLIREATGRGNKKAQALTEGRVKTIGQNALIRDVLAEWGVYLPNMKKDTIAEHWDNWDEYHAGAPARAKRLLELRATLGSASVKKLHSLSIKSSSDGRMRELFAFCGADRTGRFSGRGAQPQNLPNSGPKVTRCDAVNGCGHHYGKHLNKCPWCGLDDAFSDSVDWCVEAVDDALLVINHDPSYDYVSSIFGDPVAIVSACLRGLFISAQGHDLLCSDYSAIEAVVLACLAGEQWRVDVFNTHGKIYEASAAQAFGVSIEEILQHKKNTGDHHPYRKRGKVRELAYGYQGGVGAAKNFGADKFMSDEEIDADIKAWRKESPSITKFWYQMNDAAIAAVQSPGQPFEYRGITYYSDGNILYCTLLSGRMLKYHNPSIVEGKFGKPQVAYWGRGGQGGKWVMLDTYGGKLTENIVQATARDIMTHAMLNVQRAGYNIVLHVHDELVCEVPEGWGSVEELERIMATLPAWCSDWPIRAAGGWRGKRYRKD